MRRSPLAALLIFTLSLFLLSPATGAAHILDVAQRRYVTLPEMIVDLQRVQLIFMGELHDREGHHQAQLQVIRALHEKGGKVAVALEMFRSDSQQTLDRWVAGEIPEKDFLRIYNENWSMWPQYRDIFHYARRERLPLIGLNISREITQQVAKNGMASLSPRQLAELPGVRCDVDDRYQEFIRRALGGHGHEGVKFRNFCEAQMLWDNVMAQTLVDYLARHPDTTIVILAGSGHSWKHGIPEQVRRRAPIEMRVLLPEVQGRVEPGNMSTEEADYLLLGLDEAPLH